MDTFAALALGILDFSKVSNLSIATDPPSAYVLKRKPDPKSAPLKTLTMWKMIVSQAIYQLAVTLVLYIKTVQAISAVPPGWNHLLTNTCSYRRIDNRLNIMEGILRNRWFIGIQVIIIGGQIMIIFLGGKAFSVRCLDQPSQWAVSVLLGALTVPIGVMIRLIPDKLIFKVIMYIWPRVKGPGRDVSGESRHYGWDLALEKIRDQPAFMKKVRGGRLRHIIHKHPKFSSSPTTAHNSRILLRYPQRLKTRRPVATSWIDVRPLRLHLSEHL